MRRIDTIIIHCTATPEGRTTTVSEVTAWHKQRGFTTIGYHYLIGLNGEVWTGRDEKMAGAHCEGHNANSIGICYVGGLAKDGKSPKDTRTTAQRAAMVQLVKTLKEKYPGVTIHGHNEFAAKACPSFNVKAWCKNEGL
jgi:N-acetylmuramoyl-L-alanine amidase